MSVSLLRVFSIKKESIILVLCISFIFAAITNSIWLDKVSPIFFMPLSKKIIIIDAGHGGWDPGKVADNNIYEKNINLSISKKLQEYLEQSGAFVLMTRFDDKALGNRKIKDMQERKEIANQSKADILISIHQNSFVNNRPRGAQVFYCKNSDASKTLASFIQEKIKENLDKNNFRVAKTNSSYFILRKINIPSVIVECGFLSNSQDLSDLCDESYQNKIAWSIYLGILDYFNSFKK